MGWDWSHAEASESAEIKRLKGMNRNGDGSVSQISNADIMGNKGIREIPSEVSS